jgi:RNA polymerase sigma factor (sigma-70 family)
MRLMLENAAPPADDGGRGSEVPFDLEQVYRAHYATLQRFVARRVADGDAADVVQESFWKLSRHVQEDRPPPDCPGSWLTRVAMNLIIDRRRRTRFRGVHELYDDQADGRGTPDPVTGIEARDEIARVDAALLALPQLTRDIFLLHRLGGHSYAEIASARRLSVKQVEKHIAKTLAHLRRHLRPEG